MLQWKLACIFFDIYDIFTIVQTCKYLHKTEEEIYRSYLIERIKLTNEFWLDLFVGKYTIAPYEYKVVADDFIELLNHRLLTNQNQFSWKTFALLYNLNFQIYPSNLNTIQSGSDTIALRKPLKSLLMQHKKLLKIYTKEKANFTCLKSNINHQYEEHILKIENIANIIKKIPRGIRGLQENMKKRKQIFEKSLSVKRLCGNFTKKVSVIRSLQLSLDRDTHLVDKKSKLIDKHKRHLEEIDHQIDTLREFKYAYIRSVHKDTINTNIAI